MQGDGPAGGAKAWVDVVKEPEECAVAGHGVEEPRVRHDRYRHTARDRDQDQQRDHDGAGSSNHNRGDVRDDDIAGAHSGNAEHAEVDDIE